MTRQNSSRVALALGAVALLTLGGCAVVPMDGYDVGAPVAYPATAHIGTNTTRFVRTALVRIRARRPIPDNALVPHPTPQPRSAWGHPTPQHTKDQTNQPQSPPAAYA